MDPIAQTAAGKVRGVLTGQVMAFKGVPYAGAERFMPPTAPAPWAGVREAAAFGPNAPQINPAPPPGPIPVILAHLPPPPGAAPPPAMPESEDCQVLNVWTAGLKDGRKRPVMVWLHGGFFYSGSGSTVNGATLAGRGDVVVVSVNHRLNAFGFTHLAQYGSEFGYSGNAGMLDIIAALEWVQDNIEAFGGDPSRVMVFGCSGGGMKTTFLSASPRARGLIHRAAVQSGPGLKFMERDAAAQNTERLLAELAIKPANVSDLRTAPMADLLGAYHRVAAADRPKRFTHLPHFAPVIDADLLPEHPFSPTAAPLTQAIPMLIGSNGQEMSFFMGADAQGFELDEAGLHARAQSRLGEAADDVLALYAAAYPGSSPARRWLNLFTDYSVAAPAIAQAERKTGAAAWMYRLDLQSPALGGKLGATHTIDGPLAFGNGGGPLLAGSKAAPALSDRMSRAWAAFAQTGDPNDGASGLPAWPAYEAEKRHTMIFDETCAVVSDPRPEIRKALAAFVEG